MFFKIGVFKNFASFKGPYLESNFNKVASLISYNFIKKRLQHKCFLWNLQNFKNIFFFLQNTCSGFSYVYQVDPCFVN